MRRILDVNLDDARVTVEPGVTNIEVSQAVAPTHTYPPDPSSQIVCSIGGNVAENSGGAHCFKYGFTTNYVTGLEVVLPDGEMMWLGGPELDPAGPGPDRRVRGLGGHAGRGHQGHPAGHPRAGGGAHAGGLLRLPRPRGRGGVGDRLGGHRARGDRDDGQPLDPGRRGRHQRRLPHRRRRGAGGRARRPRGRVRGALRGDRLPVRGGRAPTRSAWPRTRPSAR